MSSALVILEEQRNWSKVGQKKKQQQKIRAKKERFAQLA